MSVHFKQDEPDTSNRLDDMKQGVIGAPLLHEEGDSGVTPPPRSSAVQTALPNDGEMRARRAF